MAIAPTMESNSMHAIDFHHDPDWAREYRRREVARLRAQQQAPDEAVFAQQLVPICEQAIRREWTDTQLADAETAVRVFRLRILNERSFREVAQVVGRPIDDVVRISKRVALICKETIQQTMEEEASI